MNIRMQLIRAGAALAIIGSVAAAESLSPITTDADCPFAKTARPQRILLLDPIQKHPTWIDARRESPGDGTLQSTVDSNHDDLVHGIVVS
ncbi:MAG TPA: hypothetical protein VGO25_04285 [Rhodanobacteraceae bacterium]|nr:hypothetical protein [Rhodanobacteraceae bacterium]